jgi:hypothetical protein
VKKITLILSVAVMGLMFGSILMSSSAKASGGDLRAVGTVQNIGGGRWAVSIVVQNTTSQTRAPLDVIVDTANHATVVDCWAGGGPGSNPCGRNRSLGAKWSNPAGVRAGGTQGAFTAVFAENPLPGGVLVTLLHYGANGGRDDYLLTAN